jgi:hypothetical protein
MKCENSATKGGPGASHSAISISISTLYAGWKNFRVGFGVLRHSPPDSQRFGSGIAKHGLGFSEGKWTNPTLLELWHSAPVAMAAGSVSQSDIDNEVHPGRGDG